VKEQATKVEVEQQVAKAQGEVERIRKELENLANKSDEEAVELRLNREKLEEERLKLAKRLGELEQHEKELGEVEAKHKQWEEKLQKQEASTSTKGADNLVASVRDAQQDVQQYSYDLAAKLAQAEEAREKLTESEILLKERVKRLEMFLTYVEQQGLLPHAMHFRNLLKAIKHLKHTKKVKCFISYAWQPSKEDNASLQAKLVKLKADLMKAGIEGKREEQKRDF
jgi:hypothetical protein